MGYKYNIAQEQEAPALIAAIRAASDKEELSALRQRAWDNDAPGVWDEFNAKRVALKLHPCDV